MKASHTATDLADSQTKQVRHCVVIVGCGFGGLFAARALRHAEVDVTVRSQQSHLFQPLLHQVATAILAEGDIAPPIRDILRHQRNATVLLARRAEAHLSTG